MALRLKALIVCLFFSFSLPTLGNSDLSESREENRNECLETHHSDWELYYPSSMEGVASSLVYWSMYPVAWLFGVEGLLIMIPSKYPNGTVRSWGG